MADSVFCENNLLIHIFSILSTPQDIGRCALVCRTWNAAALDDGIWKSMCEHKFGQDVASQAIADEHYDGNWRQMLQDDCRKAANLTLYRGISCPWKYNGRNNQYYCCWIESIVWNRASDSLEVYIDVRGEVDLRHPSTSGFRFCSAQGEIFGEVQPPSNKFTWISDIERTTGHHKGKITVPLELILRAMPPIACELLFQFAGRGGRAIFGIDFNDYTTSNILTIPVTKTPWLDAFRTAKYTLDVSPFASDTPEIERQRWRMIFPDEVLNRTQRVITLDEIFREMDRLARELALLEQAP